MDSNGTTTLPPEMWDAVLRFLPRHLLYVDFVCRGWRGLRVAQARRDPSRSQQSPLYQKHVIEQATPELLGWSLANGMRCRGGFLSAVVKSGNVEMLRALLTARPKLAARIAAKHHARAAGHGNLEMMKCLRDEFGAIAAEEVARRAALGRHRAHAAGHGNLEMMKRLRGGFGTIATEEAARRAALGGHQHVLRWLYLECESIPAGGTFVRATIVANADTEVFDVLFRNGKLRRSVCSVDRAARLGHVACLAAFADTSRLRPSAEALIDAASKGHRSVFEMDDSPRWRPYASIEIMRAAFANGHDELALLIRKQHGISEQCAAQASAEEGRWHVARQLIGPIHTRQRLLAIFAAKQGRLDELVWACGSEAMSESFKSELLCYAGQHAHVTSWIETAETMSLELELTLCLIRAGVIVVD